MFASFNNNTNKILILLLLIMIKKKKKKKIIIIIITTHSYRTGNSPRFLCATDNKMWFSFHGEKDKSIRNIYVCRVLLAAAAAGRTWVRNRWVIHTCI